MPAKKKEEKEIVKCDSRDLLQGLLEDSKKHHFAFVDSPKKRISMSSLIVDSHCKIHSGSIVRLNGKGAELGKTSQALVLAENYMNTMPKSKTIYIKAESRLSPQLQKRSGAKFVFSPQDWIEGTIFVYPGNVFEVIAKMLETLVHSMYENGEHLCIIWDSLDGTILQDDLEKPLWDPKESNAKIAGVPLLTKLLFKRLALPMDYYNALLIVTSQYTANISLDPYSAEPPRQNTGGGGNSLNHMSSYTFTFLPRWKKSYILEKPKEKPDLQDNKILGINVSIEVSKSADDITGMTLEYPIKKNKIGCAIWQEKEVVDFSLAYEVLIQKGSWFQFIPEVIAEAAEEGIELKEKIQGLPAVYDYMEENESVFKWFYKRFSDMIAE